VSRILAKNYSIFHVSILVMLGYITFTSIVFVLFLPTLLFGNWMTVSVGADIGTRLGLLFPLC
jgi:hypothetical protein